MKRFISFILGLFVVFSSAFVCAEENISVIVNDKKVAFDVPPMAESGRTLVPMRAIFEALGAVVTWDNSTQTAFAERNGNEIELELGNKVMYVNDKAVGLDVPAKAVNSRTLVPIRAISEAFGCDVSWNQANSIVHISEDKTLSQMGIPPYSGEPYVFVNNNVPYFYIDNYKSSAFEMYLPEDKLGRCTYAMAMVGEETMPNGDRESLSSVTPSGWHSVTYDNVTGGYLYNRCHLIGHQLSGENANEYNLITVTRYLNIEGMLPFENLIADYIKETGGKVLYRVTPVFEDNDLVAKGVLMEAASYEDRGYSICFNVFCYNVQPGITINYADGTSYSQNKTETRAPATGNYVLNTNSKKFHYPSCSSVSRMSAKNREDSNLSRDVIVSYGYSPCGICKP